MKDWDLLDPSVKPWPEFISAAKPTECREDAWAMISRGERRVPRFRFEYRRADGHPYRILRSANPVL